MSKAVELPVNVLVIVAIAVIVLLGLVVLYFIGFDPFSGSISITSLRNQGCGNFTLNYDCGSRGATTSDIILPANSYGVTNLLDLCTQKFGVSGDSECRAFCGCGGVIGGSSPGPGPGPCTCDWIPNPGTHIGDCVIGIPGCWPICNCNPSGCGLRNNIRCTFGPNQYPEGTVGSLVNSICITVGCPP
jgi:hypothetical protein